MEICQMPEEVHFSWWTHRDQRGSSSSRLALQRDRLCTRESSERGRAISSRYWVLRSRDGLSHLFSRPFTPVMSGRSLMALHHQLKKLYSGPGDGEWKNSSVHKCCLLILLHMMWCDCEANPFATIFLGDKKAV